MSDYEKAMEDGNQADREGSSFKLLEFSGDKIEPIGNNY